MENLAKVVCVENEALANYIWNKRQEMARDSKPLTENRDKTIQRAYYNVCNSKHPIPSLRDFSKIKGVGKWILRLMQGFFADDSGSCEHVYLPEKGKKPKRTKCYMPQKNSVAYALLITLYRGTSNGSEFMRKQELIDAAEASGLSRAPIAPEKGKGKPGQFGSSPRDWYSGWSCMKTLITKGLAVRSSCPAKYMLTDEGRQAAQDCMLRSNLLESVLESETREALSDTETADLADSDIICADSYEGVRLLSVDPTSNNNSHSIPFEYLKKFTDMGYSNEQILRAFAQVSTTSPNKEVSSLWPAVLCCLKEEQVYGSHFESQRNLERDTSEMSTSYISAGEVSHFTNRRTPLDSTSLNTCSSSARKTQAYGAEMRHGVLRMPPLNYWEKFDDVYEVILILDHREHFARGSKSGTIIGHICTQFKIKIEVRCLPVGDAIWAARHKQLQIEYVLDFIVERKKVDDLRSSIRDNRYKDQKLRLLRCGLKKLIYVVEGDPDRCEGSDCVKTACFTTEILEGFDVQRTSGLGDTLRRYGYLTHAIASYYKLFSSEDRLENARVCPSFVEFIRRCENLDKMTISDVFATQLMQVHQVTEEVAIEVLELYPTLNSLAHAYALLDGDIQAQEEMLKNQTNNAVNAAASRNIFEFIWGS